MPPPRHRGGGIVLAVANFFSKALSILRWSTSTGFHESRAYLASPWSDSSSLSVVTGVATGQTAVSVEQALKVPAVTRTMGLFSAVAAGSPLVAEGGQVPWLSRTTGPIGPGKRNADMFQSLFWYNEACLLVDRDADGTIVDAECLPRHLWNVDELGRVCIAGVPVTDQSNFIWIPGLLPAGFLAVADVTIAHYFDILSAIASRSKNPIPLVELHITEAFEGGADELAQALEDWRIARQSENGAVAFTPAGIELITHEPATSEGAMLIDARNAVRLDIANYGHVNASLLEGANGASDTYENTLQSKDEFISLSFALFAGAITQRLSQDDVTPPGVTVRFDTSYFERPTDAAGNIGTAVNPTLKEVTA